MASIQLPLPFESRPVALLSPDELYENASQEIHELRINKKEIDWEQEPSILRYRASVQSEREDFDPKLIHDFVERVRRSRELSESLNDEEIMELRRLGRMVQGEFEPNRACSLMFARDPVREFPGCKIRFLRFDGEDERTGEKYNAVKDIMLEGPIPLLIQDAEKVVDYQLREFSRLGPDGRFYTAPEYPKAAWYEAIVNACVHRSYGLKSMVIFIKMFDDRLVIESPGGFPPLVTPDNIFDMHAPRNPFLMDALFYLDYVKCAHEGTRRMRDSMKEMDLPVPEFRQMELAHPLVRVTLKNNVKQRKVWVDSDASAILGESIFQDLNEPERRAVNFIAEHGSINVSQLQRLVGKTWHTNKKILDGLVSRSILKHVKRSDVDRDPNARYELRNGRSRSDLI